MNRMTIRLGAGLKAELRLEASRQGLSTAGLIRAALEKYLATHRSAPSPGWGLFQSGFADTSEQAEEILAVTGFGHERRRASPRQ